ncbi:MAG: hypothetical protein ACYC7J_04040 [Syntrophales bacterium]
MITPAFKNGVRTRIPFICACICAAVFVTAPLCHGGAVSEKERWESARKANSINAYAAFLKEFPATDKKDEISKKADSLIVSRIAREVKERGAKVYDKALNGTGILPLSTTMKAGGTLVAPEETALTTGIHIFPDPTNPIRLRPVPDPTKPASQLFELVGGRGAVMQEYQGRIAIYVFGLDVSSPIASWEKIPVDKFYYMRGVPRVK